MGQYTVARGDTLSKIATRLGTTVDAILALNPQVRDKDEIRVGAVLSVPDGDGVIRLRPITIRGDPKFYQKAERSNAFYSKNPPRPGWPYDEQLEKLWARPDKRDFADAVRKYQIEVMGETDERVDGILGPRTAAALAKRPMIRLDEEDPAGKQTGLDPLQRRDPAPSDSLRPFGGTVEIFQDALEADFSPLRVRILGELERGDVVLDVYGGHRVLIGYMPPHVVFVTGDGRIWVQVYEGFESDVGLAHLAEGARGAKKLLMRELKFVLGYISALSTGAFVGVLGFEVVWFAVEHRNDLEDWSEKLGLFLVARKRLKEHAPRLYDALWSTAAREIFDRLPEEIGAEDTAKFMGQLIATVAITKFGGAKEVLVAVGKTLGRAVVPALKAAGSAGQGLGADVQAAAERIIVAFSGYGVPLTLDEALAILREYNEHREIVDAALADIESFLNAMESIGK